MRSMGVLIVGAAASLAGPAFAEPLSIRPSSLPEAVAPRAIGTTLFWDNDGGFAKPNGRTDRHYTSGQAVAVHWQAPWVNDLLARVPSLHNEFDPAHTQYGMGAITNLDIYTPEDITNPDPLFNDRPYAGWLYVGLIAQRSARAPGKLPVYEHFELDLGMVGPHSYADDLQTYIHEKFDYDIPQGWQYQIRDEFGVDFKYQRRYRIDLLPTHIDLLPEAGVTLGTIHMNANAGATLRFGFNLPDDFGPTRKELPGDFTRRYSASRELTWENFVQSFGAYGFIRASGVLVGHDTTLEGSFFKGSPVEADKEWAYADLQYGIAIQFLRHCEFAYSQTWRSPQFDGQHNWDSFGSLSLSLVWTW